MKTTAAIIFSFIGGAALGGFIGYKLTKKKYENIADDEVESVKKAFEEMRERDQKEFAAKLKNDKKTIDYKKTSDMSKKESDAHQKDMNQYIDYSNKYQTETSDNRIPGTPEPKTKKVKKIKEPYTITPDEFQDSHYEAITLLYFTDKVLSTDEYVVIDNPGELIGLSALGEFGKYEEDVVYVRDDVKGVDYEVLADERSYKKASSTINPKHKLTDYFDEDEE